MFGFKKSQIAEDSFQEGMSFLQHANYKAAIDCFRRALNVFEELKDQQNIAKCLRIIGYSKSQIQDKEALTYCQESLQICRKINDKQGQSTSLQYMGQIYRHNRNYEEAIQCFEESIKFSNELHDTEGLMTTYFDIGNLYTQLSEFKLSIQYFEQSLDIAKKQHRKYYNYIGIIDLSLAQLHHELGHIEKSKELFSESLKIAKELNDTLGIINSTIGIGIIYASEMKFREAIKSYNSILVDVSNTGNRKLLSIVFNNLADSYNNNKEFDSALQHSLKALKIANEEGMEDQKLNIFGVLGSIHHNMGNVDKAIECYENQYSTASKGSELRSKMNACTNLGNIYHSKKEYSRSWQYLEEALNLFNKSLEQVGNNTTLKISFAETSRFLYKSVIMTLHKMQRHEDALKYSEESRAREINLLLNDYTIIDWDFSSVVEYCRTKNKYIIEYYVIHDAANTNNSNPTAINFFISTVIFWIISPNGELRSDCISISDLWKSLPNEFTKNGTDVNAILGLPNPNSLNRKKMDVSQENESKQVLKKLYEYLFKPITKFINKSVSDKILIIPHYEIFLFPFNAFINDENNHLIDEFSFNFGLSIHTNLLLWKNLNNRNILTSMDFLVVGNPDMPTINLYDQIPVKLSDLPHAEKESIEIAKQLKTEPLTKHNATKYNVMTRMPESTVIHFATHSLLNQNPNDISRLPGLIALAPTNGDNGILYSTDIAKMDLSKVSLVVLSACDTGKGMMASEGIVGLVWAFIKAGVKGIVVSLWSIDDEAPHDIMIEFYKNMLNGEESPGALRAATIKIMKQNKQFIDWSPFVYVGESK